MTSAIQLGDYVRFREGHVPEALQGRERDLGIVIALVPHRKDEQWPVVQFDGYRTAAVAPGVLDVVGGDWPAQDFAAGATKA